jgi:glycosyltransferase involved in cell wall biosynthesis
MPDVDPSAAASPAPAISVVIPAYNRAATIRVAIESVLRQTWTDFELIVVDDCSADDTLAEVARVDDPRLRVIESPINRGAASARNAGVEEARAAWVAFQDSDDEWLPTKLEKQMSRLAALGPDQVAAYCGMIVLGRKAPPNGAAPKPSDNRPAVRYFPPLDEPVVEGDLLVPLLRKNLISTQTLIARRDALREMGGFDASMRALEDWDCAIRLAQMGPIAFVDEPLVVQRFSANSISNDHARVLGGRVQIAEKHAAILARHPAIHAEHYDSIATRRQKIGDLSGARAALAQAHALRPRDPRYWAIGLRMAMRSLTSRGAAARLGLTSRGA